MVGGEHSLQISAPQLLRFGIDSVLKILNKDHSIIQSMNHKGFYRTAPAKPGLLITYVPKLQPLNQLNSTANH